MKKILLILATAALSLGSFAGNPDDNNKGKHDPNKYCAEMKDGVLKVMHNNEEITQEVTLSNGTTIHPDGTITGDGGYSRMLKPGECVNLDGEIDDSVPAEKNSDSFDKDKNKGGYDKTNKENMEKGKDKLDRNKDKEYNKDWDEPLNKSKRKDMMKDNPDNRPNPSKSDEEPK